MWPKRVKIGGARGRARLGECYFFPQPWENSHCVCRLCGLEPSRRLETERGQPEHRPTKVMPTHKPSPPRPNRIPPRNGQGPPRGFAVGLAEDWYKVPILTEQSARASIEPQELEA